MFFFVLGYSFFTINLAAASSSESPPSFSGSIGVLKSSVLSASSGVVSFDSFKFLSSSSAYLSISKCQLDHAIVNMIISKKVLSPNSALICFSVAPAIS